MVGILRTERPQVVVTYDADGGTGTWRYHVQANRVTMARVWEIPLLNPASRRSWCAPWRVAKV